MITKQEQINNWIIIGIQQPADRIRELFYFDKRDKEFFSILVTDYFLFDENGNTDEGISSTYTAQTVEKLSEKIKRIENQSSEIVALPRLGTSNHNEEIEYLSAQIDSFLNLNGIDVDDSIIWLPEEIGTITIKL